MTSSSSSPRPPLPLDIRVVNQEDAADRAGRMKGVVTAGRDGAAAVDDGADGGDHDVSSSASGGATLLANLLRPSKGGANGPAQRRLVEEVVAVEEDMMSSSTAARDAHATATSALSVDGRDIGLHAVASVRRCIQPSTAVSSAPVPPRWTAHLVVVQRAESATGGSDGCAAAEGAAIGAAAYAECVCTNGTTSASLAAATGNSNKPSALAGSTVGRGDKVVTVGHALLPDSLGGADASSSSVDLHRCAGLLVTVQFAPAQPAQPVRSEGEEGKDPEGAKCIMLSQETTAESSAQPSGSPTAMPSLSLSTAMPSLSLSHNDSQLTVSGVAGFTPLRVHLPWRVKAKGGTIASFNPTKGLLQVNLPDPSASSALSPALPASQPLSSLPPHQLKTLLSCYIDAGGGICVSSASSSSSSSPYPGSRQWQVLKALEGSAITSTSSRSANSGDNSSTKAQVGGGTGGVVPSMLAAATSSPSAAAASNTGTSSLTTTSAAAAAAGGDHELPEDRFLRADALSMHFLAQRQKENQQQQQQ